MQDFAPLLRRVLRWPVVLLWMAVLFGLSSIPNEPTPTPSRVPFDKVAHFGVYALLAFIMAGAACRYLRRRRLTLVLAAACVAASVLYGVSDEFHQRYTPGRDPSIDDLAADVAGSVAGTYAIAWVLRRVDVDDG